MESNQQHQVVDLTVDSDDGSSTAQNSPKKRRFTRYNLRDNIKIKYSQSAGTKYVVSKKEVPHETLSKSESKMNSNFGGFGAENDTDADSTTEDNQSDFSDSDKDLDVKSAVKDGLSAYELLRQERIKRNNAKLESLGFTVKPNTHEEKRKSSITKRRPISSKPMRKYPKRGTNANRASSKIVQTKQQKQQKVKLVPFEGDHDDDCYICEDGGKLICCDYCSKVFHMQCHIPPLTTLPGEDWACCECKATQMTRANRCGECVACTRPDCGTCTYCRDKKRFGGPNIIKQACVHKRCPNKRYAPPTKMTREKMRRVPNDAIFKGSHHDECYICYDGGDLLCCDFCPKVYHLHCHIPALKEVPEDGIDWRCCECLAEREQFYSTIREDPKCKHKSPNLSKKEDIEPSYDEDEYGFLCKYYLDKVKRYAEELPGGMVLRAKSAQCNLLRYSKCQFRQKLFKKIHRLKRQCNNQEIHRMLKVLYEHDISGKQGDGPKELMEQIMGREDGDSDDLELINQDEVDMEVFEVDDDSDTQAADDGNEVRNIKVKEEDTYDNR